MYQATDEEIALARKIIKEGGQAMKLQMSNEVIEEKANEILNISYSIGGGYDQNTLKKIAQSILKREGL